MTKQAVIERLCRMTETVGSHFGNHYATDCFCGTGGFNRPGRPQSDENYRFDEAALKFIEDAVARRIARLFKAESA